MAKAFGIGVRIDEPRLNELEQSAIAGGVDQGAALQLIAEVRRAWAELHRLRLENIALRDDGKPPLVLGPAP